MYLCLLQWCSQFPGEEEILFAPLTGLEVMGTPRVDERSLVVELRLNTNLHDLTIEQVVCVCVALEVRTVFGDCCESRLTGPSCQVSAKMKKTHIELVHTIEMDMIMEGFSPASLQLLTGHKTRYEKEKGSWFNNSDNYKHATNAVIDAKLEICAGVLKSLDEESAGKERVRAAQMLFNENDGAALAKGIATILTDARLLKEYGPMLNDISKTASLARLDLENSGLDCE